MKLDEREQLNILLADDDRDDRFFFGMVLKEIPFVTQLTAVEDGEKLMTYLTKNTEQLPDVLFLDLNMPRKNGAECLSEIKQDPKLKSLPVIIYSTSLNDDVADELYEKGAHFYVQKVELEELKKILTDVLTLIMEKKFERPARDKFIFNQLNNVF